jgi:uncharacterized protein (DUF433 family)
MTLPDYLEQNEAGAILLRGHRIELWQLLHYYQEGQTPEMLACQYPTLSLSLIHKVIAYYLDHRDEVDSYRTAIQAEIDRQRAAEPRRLDVAELRRRLQAPPRSGILSTKP